MLLVRQSKIHVYETQVRKVTYVFPGTIPDGVDPLTLIHECGDEVSSIYYDHVDRELNFVENDKD